MAKWTAFPHDSAPYTHSPAALKKLWARLHTGDAEPLPKDDNVLAAIRRDQINLRLFISGFSLASRATLGHKGNRRAIG